MPSSVSSHDFIKEKVKALKDTYPSLRSKRDEYVFSKSQFLQKSCARP